MFGIGLTLFVTLGENVIDIVNADCADTLLYSVELKELLVV